MSNFDFSDPSNQGRDIPRDPFTTSQPGFDLENSAVVQQRIESISVLLGQIETNFKNVGDLLTNMVSNFDKSVASAEQLAKHSKDTVQHTRDQVVQAQRSLELSQKREASAKSIADLAQRAAKGEQSATNELRAQMRELSMAKSGRYFVPGYQSGSSTAQPRYVSAGDITDILQRAPGDPEREAVLARLAANRIGADQQTTNPRFRVGDLITHLSQGNIGGAVGELMQRGRTADAVTSRLEEMGLGMGGRFGGLLARGAPIIGGAFTPAVAIAAITAYRRAMTNINQQRDIGMITGQGFEEGARARIWSTFQGLNPFDMISGRDALQAQLAVRQAGFRGGTANAAADLVTDLRQKLGLPISDSAQLVVTALRTTNMSLADARTQLGSLKDAAHDAGLSVKEMADAAQTAMTTLAPLNRTAAQQAIPNIEALTAQYRGIVPRQTLGTLSGVMTAQTAQTLALRMGIPAWQALSPAFFNRLPELLNQFILSLAQRKPASMDFVDYANFLFMADQTIATMFQATGPQGLADLMKGIYHQVQHGGVAALQRGQAQQQATSGAISAAQAFNTGRGSISPGLRIFTPRQILSGGRAALQQLERSGRDMGLTQEQLARVIGPLQQDIAGGDTSSIQSDIAYGGRELGTLARHGNVTVKVAMAPGFDRYMRATAQWDEVARGRRSAQEVPRY
jgi:hypothetical protein